MLTLVVSLLLLADPTMVSTHFAQREQRSTTTRGCEEESIDARVGRRSGEGEYEEDELEEDELEEEEEEDEDVLNDGAWVYER